MINLKYPKDFVREVKDLFPNDKEMHDILDSGDPYVSTMLNRRRKGPVSAEKIVDAVESGNQEGLYEDAKIAVRIERVCNTCAEIIRDSEE